jgi:hypothetical protein
LVPIQDHASTHAELELARSRRSCDRWRWTFRVRRYRASSHGRDVRQRCWRIRWRRWRRSLYRGGIRGWRSLDSGRPGGRRGRGYLRCWCSRRCVLRKRRRRSNGQRHASEPGKPSTSSQPSQRYAQSRVLCRFVGVPFHVRASDAHARQRARENQIARGAAHHSARQRIAFRAATTRAAR